MASKKAPPAKVKKGKGYGGIDEPIKEREPVNTGGSDLPGGGDKGGGRRAERRAVLKKAQGRGERMSTDLASGRGGGKGKKAGS